MKLLVVDCCIRGSESRTEKLYKEYLKHLSGKWDVEILKLAEEDLKPLNAKNIVERDRCVKEGCLTDPLLRYANAFKDADRIVVAAPYWDLSFPSLLKVYFEYVSVSGVTFGYEGADCVGYCKADRLVYLSTCGGYIQGRHLGAEYVEALAAMLGIDEFYEFSVQGLDIDPTKVQEIMERETANMIEKMENNLL